ncbi:MAG: hypothetical protein KGJ79_02385 [Alphaproteobacteria bacterium]|nr:hypothetical protein [Alphaproteobacteria bacterium]MDE2109962.1 hypothetical protein [Alphaproteobacteria bacterium]MDE2496115.1 hypothetical protein [Alphaproteobacteria bacterium]
MSALMDIWNTIHAILTSADWITLALIAVCVLAAGFAIQGLNAIVSATVLALVGFAVLIFARAVTMGGHPAVAYANTVWHDFLGLQMLTLIAYAVIFAVLIVVVHVIRSAVFR